MYSAYQETEHKLNCVLADHWWNIYINGVLVKKKNSFLVFVLLNNSMLSIIRSDWLVVLFIYCSIRKEKPQHLCLYVRRNKMY